MNNEREIKVVFTPSGRRGTFPSGTPLLQAARILGVDIDSVCGGRGLCGRCQIVCTPGSFPKHELVSDLSHLSPLSSTEKHFSERKRELKPGRRLSCHTLLLGDVVIDVPAESQVFHQVVRKDAEHRDIKLDPNIHLYSVQVDEPDMFDAKGDVQRLLIALEREWQITGIKLDASLLGQIQPVLRKGKWFITVAIYQRSLIIAMWPGFHSVALGVAIDVGSTTIAAHLCDLASGDVLATDSCMNPQIRFGEDLMSRVSHLMMHPDAAPEMTSVIRDALNSLISNATAKVDATVADVLEVSIVGNPIMHHILLGISPVELGGAPFALATDSALDLSASQLDMAINPGGRIYVLPCIAGHVGADMAGVILAEEPHLQDEMTLLVDVGTNAEIVLGNRQRLLACSSPTGPAFEGAQISCGQRAAAGAIERVRIDPASLEPRFRIIGSDRWSDEPGFDEGIGVSGICGSGIIEVVAEMYLSGIVSADGVIQGDGNNPRVFQSGRTWSYLLHEGEATISVSQNDVRQIQLAKAALYAGIKLLMDKIGVDQVARIRLAGAFGSQISVKHAMVLGLIPDCPLKQVSAAGNAAGTGARIALLSRASRREIEDLVRTIEKIETAVETDFQEYFIQAMAFPHKQDPFLNLFSKVDRPVVKSASSGRGTARRSRRRK